MTKYVFTVREDIMQEYGKDSQRLTMLLQKMREYGTIEEYDTVFAKATSETADELARVKAQYDNAKSRAVSDEEAEIINKVRDIGEQYAAVYKSKYETLRSKVSAAQLQAKQKRELAKRQLEEADRAMASIGLDVDTAE